MKILNFLWEGGFGGLENSVGRFERGIGLVRGGVWIEKSVFNGWCNGLVKRDRSVGRILG